MLLRLIDIVATGEVAKHSAQHVLKFGAAGLGLPEGEAKGVHRRYTFRQAVRLAMAAKLIRTWTPLDGAIRTVRYCEDRARDLTGLGRDDDGPLYDGRLSAPWELVVTDRGYAMVWCKSIWRARPPVDWDDWLDVATNKRVGGHELRDPTAEFKLNLTALERVLLQAARVTGRTEGHSN